jgi:hypothetical protein
VTARRIIIVVAVLGVVHNLARLTAAAFGANGTIGNIFNYLGPYRPQPHVVAGDLAAAAIILLGTAWLARFAWRMPVEERSNSFWRSALLSAVLAAVVALVAVLIGTQVERLYGWVLFVFVPIAAGFGATLLLAQSQPIRGRDVIMVSGVSVLLLGVGLMAFAIEGAICLLMSLPLALPLAWLGGYAGYGLAPRFAARGSTTLLVIAGLLPFGATVERALDLRPGVFAVSTSIDLRQSPERVWQTILEPAKLAAPTHAVFRAGIAYPLASHIEGAGLTATRYCDFSTGKLVEPVLVWDNLRRLRFTVVSNPLPMQEWTPYARIHPPHLDGFLVSRQGEFALMPLPDGGTRLIATTWYQHHLWPAHYWRWWSGYIIHRVHEMVLENVRQRAQPVTIAPASTASAAASPAAPARPAP